jgi:hypothetical protein
MTSAEEIAKEYFTHYWVSETGLGRLDRFPGDSQGDGENETVLNENGILFLVYFLICCDLSGVSINEHKDSILKTVRTLEREPGLYCRQPNNFVRHEAHDNYAAIATCSVMWPDLPFAREICGYGSRNGYNFNNVEPGKWELKQQRQGGEIGFYKACAAYAPTIWEWLWLLGGILTNAFSKPDASTTQLTWMRLYALQKVHFKTSWQALFFYPVLWIWQFRFKQRYKTLGGLFAQYFKEEHPIRAMAVHAWK